MTAIAHLLLPSQYYRYTVSATAAIAKFPHFAQKINLDLDEIWILLVVALEDRVTILR
ncbi:MAG: hypothetical protein J7647_25990 [Cyanobacteria bacterium SBLK]|nr:hypothetical protein [Cyanobacteria bacterium SBLK]